MPHPRGYKGRIVAGLIIVKRVAGRKHQLGHCPCGHLLAVSTAGIFHNIIALPAKIQRLSDARVNRPVRKGNAHIAFLHHKMAFQYLFVTDFNFRFINRQFFSVT